LAWSIEYTKTATDQLRKLDKSVARRIVGTMDERVAMLENPRQIGKALKGPLGEFWCYRIGDYRIICEIHDDVISILVVQIGNRREVYR
jgi:mRNA interferase RelE/StbE